jgi:hypothetical protein
VRTITGRGIETPQGSACYYSKSLAIWEGIATKGPLFTGAKNAKLLCVKRGRVLVIIIVLVELKAFLYKNRAI